MLTRHSIRELEGKVSQSILEQYDTDFNNLLLASLVAGYHRAYGLKNEGIAMSMEIIGNIDDNTVSLRDRNILTWNLYLLSREFIDDDNEEGALRIIERLEKNWSRDTILGDEVGFCHVSWMEQIYLRRLELYLLTGDHKNFEIYSDMIIHRRMEFFNKAIIYTGENIIGDRCTYSCLELMALNERRRNLKCGLSLMKSAIIHKGCNIDYATFRECDLNPKLNTSRYFDILLKLFYFIPESPFDGCKYGYCNSCIDFDGEGKCLKHNIDTDVYRGCSSYRV